MGPVNKTVEQALKEVYALHKRSLSESRTEVTDWKDKYEKISTVRARLAEKYRSLQEENSTAQKEIKRLLDLVTLLQTRDGEEKQCPMCGHLRASLESVNSAFKQALEEKNVLINYLEVRVAECSRRENTSDTGGHISNPLKEKQSTTFRQRETKESPDSTSQGRNKSLREPTTGRTETRTETEEENSGDKTARLRLARNRHKRSRYSEESPDAKRPRNILDVSHELTHELSKKSNIEKTSRQGFTTIDQIETDNTWTVKQGEARVLAPDTCDPRVNVTLTGEPDSDNCLTEIPGTPEKLDNKWGKRANQSLTWKSISKGSRKKETAVVAIPETLFVETDSCMEGLDVPLDVVEGDEKGKQNTTKKLQQDNSETFWEKKQQKTCGKSSRGSCASSSGREKKSTIDQFVSDEVYSSSEDEHRENTVQKSQTVFNSKCVLLSPASENGQSHVDMSIQDRINHKTLNLSGDEYILESSSEEDETFNKSQCILNLNNSGHHLTTSKANGKDITGCTRDSLSLCDTLTDIRSKVGFSGRRARNSRKGSQRSHTNTTVNRLSASEIDDLDMTVAPATFDPVLVVERQTRTSKPKMNSNIFRSALSTGNETVRKNLNRETTDLDTCSVSPVTNAMNRSETLLKGQYVLSPQQDKEVTLEVESPSILNSVRHTCSRLNSPGNIVESKTDQDEDLITISSQSSGTESPNLLSVKPIRNRRSQQKHSKLKKTLSPVKTSFDSDSPLKDSKIDCRSPSSGSDSSLKVSKIDCRSLTGSTKSKDDEVSKTKDKNISSSKSSDKKVLLFRPRGQSNSPCIDISVDTSVESPKNLCQTTLTQAFFSSPRKRSSRLQEKEKADLQKAIDLSLQEVHIDEISEKENSPPFKKPQLPSRSTGSKVKNKFSLSADDYKQDDMDVTIKDKRVDEVSRSHHKGQRDTFPDLDPHITERSNISQVEGHTGEPLNGSLDPDLNLSKWDEDTERAKEFPEDCPSLYVAHDQTLPSLENELEFDALNKGDNSLPRTSTMAMEDSEEIMSSSRSHKFVTRKKKPLSTKNSPAEPIPSLDDSFDVMPKKAEESYAHVAVVRKRDERQKVKGYSCSECYNYYKSKGLSEAEIQEQIQVCSRHRAKHLPPDTPPHFWSIGFLDTQECQERGYVEVEKREKAGPSKYRRKKRLMKHFKSKHEKSTLETGENQIENTCSQDDDLVF